MSSNWEQPADWSKDGSIISGVAGLKTGAWTSLYAAKETINGRATDVVLKTFTVPEVAREDEAKIRGERERFVISAKLQMSLVKEGSRGWVPILKMSEEPPSFTMPKCGPSVEDLLDRKVNLTGRDLYAVLQSVLVALIELKNKHNRSHGDLKASNVLASLPGENPPYRLADPTPKGEAHSANDLYNLGLILYQLIEHKEYDPLTQLKASKNWSRLGARRDRWVQFLNTLLSPNGCQDSLADVRKEAFRLKPVSPLRPVFLAMAGLILVGGMGGAYLWVSSRLNKPMVTGGGPVVSTMPVAPAELDPGVKGAFEEAKRGFQEAQKKWSAASAGRTQRYDHAKAVGLARDARGLVGEVTLTDEASYKSATELYQKASAKYGEAVVEMAAEEEAGKRLDESALADYQGAKREFEEAQGKWGEVSGRFVAGHDHSGSKALADAAVLAAQVAGQLPESTGDPAARRVAIEQYKGATAKLSQAMAMVPEEDRLIRGHEQALGAFKKAKEEYRSAKERWTAFEAGHPKLDLREARALAEEARNELPEFTATDDASVRGSADKVYKAAQKLEQALALGGAAKPLPEIVRAPELTTQKVPETVVNTVEVRGPQGTEVAVSTATAAEIAAVVGQADGALKAKKYPEAFGFYKKAAEMGSVPAMSNMGLLLETGTGTTKDFAQAAGWYKKAADRSYVPAILNLASLYQRGRGVDQNYTQALKLYRQAADLNSADAMVSLGILYENGQGTEQDFAAAMAWYKKAAELKNPAAITNIGVFYEKGRGVPVDYKEAVVWYQKAAALNYPAAMNDLATLYDTGRYENGKDVRPNYGEALKWYKAAADLDYAPAMCNLGALYDAGQGVALDHTEALKWFEKAAKKNHGMAMYNLGVLYDMGRGTRMDRGEALTWYRKAAKSDDPQAQRFALEALGRLGFSP